MTKLVGLDGKPLNSLDNKKLVGSGGEEVKVKNIPVLEFKGYSIPMRMLTSEETVGPRAQVSPWDVIKEMRGMYQEMQDRFTFLAIGLAQIALQEPNGALAQFLDSSGIVLTDLEGKPIYPPNGTPQ